jgi:hypothetical protein
MTAQVKDDRVGKGSAEVEEPADNQPTYIDRWNETWRDFNRALRSPDSFNAFLWTYRLALARATYSYHHNGLYRLKLHKIWRPLVPSFAILLVALIGFSFFTTLRVPVREQWCCQAEAETGEKKCQESCWWLYTHYATVSYLCIMILFNYLSTTFRSPGVAMNADYEDIDDNDCLSPERKWTAIEGQGGCCGFNPRLDILAERRRTRDYVSKDNRTNHRLGSKDEECFPTTESTTCRKCNISRPPRCRHCSTCKRCILQFDHHCVWVNNCIGFNNYRTFILALFWLVVGCFYSISVLFVPFYDPLRKRVLEHGFRFFYDNKTGFLDIPHPWTLVKQAFTIGIDSEVVVRLIFPFLVGVGLSLAIFLGYHVQLIVAARTQLEQTIIHERQYKDLKETKKLSRPPRNPFDKGRYANIQQVLGSNMLLVFLPVPVEPLPPLSWPNKKSD